MFLIKTKRKLAEQIVNISTTSRTTLAPEKSQKHVAGLRLEEVMHSCSVCIPTEIAEEEKKHQFGCELLSTALRLPAEQLHATRGHEGKETSREPPLGGQHGAVQPSPRSGWKEAAGFPEAPSLRQPESSPTGLWRVAVPRLPTDSSSWLCPALRGSSWLHKPLSVSRYAWRGVNSKVEGRPCVPLQEGGQSSRRMCCENICCPYNALKPYRVDLEFCSILLRKL